MLGIMSNRRAPGKQQGEKIMRKRTILWLLGAAALAGSALVQASAPSGGQASGLPLPPPVEKELASRAANVTEVTLGKNMLAFASKFMGDKDDDEAETKRLIQ